MGGYLPTTREEYTRRLNVNIKDIPDIDPKLDELVKGYAQVGQPLALYVTGSILIQHIGQNPKHQIP